MRETTILTGVLDEVIPQDQLVVGSFYGGVGRFIGDIALWTGTEFVGFQIKFGRYMETSAAYGSNGFDPICRLITTTLIGKTGGF